MGFIACRGSEAGQRQQGLQPFRGQSRRGGANLAGAVLIERLSRIGAGDEESLLHETSPRQWSRRLSPRPGGWRETSLFYHAKPRAARGGDSILLLILLLL